MKKLIPWVLTAAAILTGTAAEAATISYFSRTTNRTQIVKAARGSDYKTLWNAHTSKITENSIPDFNYRLGGNQTFSYLKVDFASGKTNLFFELAVDATYGGAVYVDNTLITKNTTDLWWEYNWKNKSEILGANVPLKYGLHKLEVFWAEECCNGFNSGRFKLGNSGSSKNPWLVLNTANLDSLKPVPVPAAVWLFGSAISGLLVSKRKKSTV